MTTREVRDRLSDVSEETTKKVRFQWIGKYFRSLHVTNDVLGMTPIVKATFLLHCAMQQFSGMNAAHFSNVLV